MKALIAEAYELYYDDLCRLLTSITGSRDDAQDIIQDTFLRLLDSSILIIPSTAKQYVFRIAKNLAIDHFRRMHLKAETDNYLRENLSVSDNGTDSALMVNEIAKYETLILNGMPERQRLIYEMRRFEDKSNPEIAKILNLSIRTVENQAYRSFTHMRAMLRKVV